MGHTTSIHRRDSRLCGNPIIIPYQSYLPTGWLGRSSSTNVHNPASIVVRLLETGSVVVPGIFFIIAILDLLVTTNSIGLDPCSIIGLSSKIIICLRRLPDLRWIVTPYSHLSQELLSMEDATATLYFYIHSAVAVPCIRTTRKLQNSILNLVSRFVHPLLCMHALTSQVQGSTAIVPDWRRSLP